MKIGILGGGQLARMLIDAGTPLGHTFRIYSSDFEESTRGKAETLIGGYEDREKLTLFASGLDLVTYEFENLSAVGVKFLESLVPVRPGARALEIGQDRAQEKALFVKLGIPTTRFSIVDSKEALRTVFATRAEPSVVKTTRMGYDGKGQCVVREQADVEKIEGLGAGPYLLENLVPFEREVSIVGARALDGSTAIYPLVENVHRNGILVRTTAPAPGASTPELERRAGEYLIAAMQELDYYGVLAIEFFERQSELIANEMAPRVHNTGHWSIDGAVTSQFENHIRAISGMPLGSPEARGTSVMINLIGELPESAPILATKGANLHLYGKSPRPGRKIGHVTFTGADRSEILLQVRSLFPSAP